MGDTWMAAADVNSPAELAEVYGEVRAHWAPGNALLGAKQRAGDLDSSGLPHARFGWATYLESARTREVTQGEAPDGPEHVRPDLGEPECWLFDVRRHGIDAANRMHPQPQREAQ